MQYRAWKESPGDTQIQSSQTLKNHDLWGSIEGEKVYMSVVSVEPQETLDMTEGSQGCMGIISTPEDPWWALLFLYWCKTDLDLLEICL